MGMIPGDHRPKPPPKSKLEDKESKKSVLEQRNQVGVHLWQCLSVFRVVSCRVCVCMPKYPDLEITSMRAQQLEKPQ